MLTGGCVGVAVGVLGVGVGCMVGVGATVGVIVGSVGVIVGSVVGWVGVSVGCAVGVGVVSSALNVQVLSTAQSSAHTTGNAVRKERVNSKIANLEIFIGVIPPIAARCNFFSMQICFPTSKDYHNET